MPEPRYLIVRIAALGDIAIASMVVNRIKSEQPGAHVTWLCGRNAEPLVRLFEGVDEVVAVDEQKLLRGSVLERIGAIARVWKSLAFRRFDTVVMLHSDRRYLALPLLTPRGRMLRTRHPWQGPGGGGGNVSLNRFRGDEYVRLLGDAPSAGPIDTSFAMADVRAGLPRSPAPAASTKRVVLAPGGARNVLRDDALRRWPLRSYRLLAEALLREGCEVVLIGDSGDIAEADAFTDLQLRNEIGRLSLTETLCELRDANVVVANDSGPLHFARLVRTPVVALFGPTNPRHVVGEDDSVTSLWGGAQLACRPCYDGLNYADCASNVCLQGISVGEVHEAVMRRLRPASGRLDRENGERRAPNVPQAGEARV